MDVRASRVGRTLEIAGWNELPEPATEAEIEYALTQLATTVTIDPTIEAGDLPLLREWAEARLRKAGVQGAEARELVIRALRRAAGMKAADRLRAEHEDEREEADGKDPEDGCDFEVHDVRIWDSDPKTYELSIDGRPVEFSARDLATPGAFSLRYANAIGPFPSVPMKRTAWMRLVNSWIARAETLSLPPDSSTEYVLREKIQEAIGQLGIGEDTEDLDRGAGVMKAGVFCFKTVAILDSISHQLKATAHTVTKILRKLGYESKATKFGDRVIRVWTSPTPEPAPGLPPVNLPGLPDGAVPAPEEGGEEQL